MIRQTFERGLYFESQFARMIDMHTHPKRMKLLKHLAEFGRNPLRQKDRYTRTDPQEFNVRNRTKALQNSFEFVVGKQESVSAREQDIADLGVSLQITVNLLKIGMKFLFSNTADDPASRAITAVRRTSVGDEKQNSVRITVNQPWYGHIAVLAARVGHFERRRNRFLDSRDHLPPNGAIWVRGIDEIEEMRSYRESKFVPREEHAGPLFVGEIDFAGQLVESCDPIFELPFPVVPETRIDLGPVTWPVGGKPLVRGF